MILPIGFIATETPKQVIEEDITIKSDQRYYYVYLRVTKKRVAAAVPTLALILDYFIAGGLI